MSFDRRVSIGLVSFDVGSYAVGSGNSNDSQYVDYSGVDLPGTSGTVTITKSDNNLFSGIFSCTLLGASSSTTHISGSFTDVPINP